MGTGMKHLMLWGLLLVLIGCTPEQSAGVPGEIPTQAAGDPGQGSVARGRELFNKTQPVSCATCHRTNSDERLVGPGLKNVGARVATYKLSQSVDDYLRKAILHPDDFIVPGYQPSIMPKLYAQMLSQQDINDLVAYLRTL